MTDQPMDGFDARLADLLAAYGDRAMTAYDAAQIARVATTRRPRARLRLGLALGMSRSARLLLVAAAVALLACAAALMAGGSPHRSGFQTSIVLGRTGPEQSAYRVPGGSPFELTLENRSDVTWVPWGGFTEKFTWCHLVSGPAVPGDPCAIAPHSTVVLRPPSVGVGPTMIYFAPQGVDYHSGIPVTVDVIAEP